jgi:hypothetical protein
VLDPQPWGDIKISKKVQGKNSVLDVSPLAEIYKSAFALVEQSNRVRRILSSPAAFFFFVGFSDFMPMPEITSILKSCLRRSLVYLAKRG